jgi:hypothetical protein
MVFVVGLHCLCDETPTSSTIVTSQQKRRNEISILNAKIAASYQGELTEQVPHSICCHCRQNVREVDANIGQIYFRQAYCMSYHSFFRLLRILSPGIQEAAQLVRKYQAKGLKSGKYMPPPIPNGWVPASV